MVTFFQKLKRASEANDSLLCVGLDPDLHLLRSHKEVVASMIALIDATVDIACVYKPNLAIYEMLETERKTEGLSALWQIIDYIRKVAPDTPIIADAKRGDIGPCAEAYANRLFGLYQFDAATVNPLMGYDSVEPFLKFEGKAIFVLCRTSNPGAKDLQDLMVFREGASEAQPLYEVVAELANEWNYNDNVGLVVGATYPEQIHRVRKICPSMIFLIPGIGFQGGDIGETVSSAIDSKGGGFILSSSRQIMYAAKNADGMLATDEAAKQRMREMAISVRDEINYHIAKALKNHPVHQLSTAN